MVGGGVAAVYFLSIQSRRFVALMNELVASMMILFSTKFRSLLPSRGKLHSASESNLFMSKPGAVSWRKKSLRIRSNWWQCGKKCLLSSMPLPHIQVGLLQSKLCRNLCSISARKFTRALKFTCSRALHSIIRSVFKGILFRKSLE